MAKYTFYCKECDEYFTTNDISLKMCYLQHSLKRFYGVPSMHVKEIIDNGFQIKRVEQPANGSELMRERNESQSKKDIG